MESGVGIDEIERMHGMNCVALGGCGVGELVGRSGDSRGGPSKTVGATFWSLNGGRCR